MDEKPFTLFSFGNRQNTRYWRPVALKDTVPAAKNYKNGKVINTCTAINWMGKSEVRIYCIRRKKKRGKG